MPINKFQIKIDFLDGFPEAQKQIIMETVFEQVKQAAWLHIQSEVHDFPWSTFCELYIYHEEEGLVYCELNIEQEYEGVSIFFE